MALTQVSEKGIKDGEIVNADINASAAIVGSKLVAATTSAPGAMSASDKTKLDAVAASANNYTHPNHTGDVTSSGDGATTIANDAVTGAKIADDAVGAEHIEDLDGNVKWLDNAEARFGTGDDLRIDWDGSRSLINSYTAGTLKLMSNGNQEFLTNGAEMMIKAIKDGAVELYHNGANKFETFSSGVKINGNLVGVDNKKIQLGSDNDLQIYHDGSHSDIDNKTGNLYIRANTSTDVGGDIHIRAKAGESSISCLDDGAVELYYDDTKRFETVDGGVKATGNINLTGHLSVEGDNKKLKFGAGEDLQIYHDGSHSFIHNDGTGNLALLADGVYINNEENTQNMITAVEGGAVSLYHADSKKFETESGGVAVTGGLTVTTNISLVDDGLIKLGTGDDLEISHDGTNSYIKNKTGDLYIKATNADTGIKVGSNGDIEFPNGGLILSEADQGINFSGGSFTAGKTSTVLDDYEEGTWTPADASTASITITNNNTARYTKIGRQVYLTFDMTWPSTSDTAEARVTAPYAATAYGGGWIGWTDVGRPLQVHQSGTNVYIMDNDSTGTGKHCTNANLSGKRVIGGFMMN